MSEAENSALARRWFDDVWNRRRDATIHELLHPDALGHLEGLEAKGVDDFVAARAGVLAAFPDFRLDVEELVAQGDSVVARWSAKGTHRGALLDIKATQQPVAFRGITWLRFADGRIVEGWDAWNQGGLVSTLQVAAAAMPE